MKYKASIVLGIVAIVFGLILFQTTANANFDKKDRCKGECVATKLECPRDYQEHDNSCRQKWYFDIFKWKWVYKYTDKVEVCTEYENLCAEPEVLCEDENALNYGKEEECEYPEPTPQTPYVPAPQPPNPALPPVCSDLRTVKLPINFFVIRNGAEAELRWVPTEGDKVNIYVRLAETNELVGAKGDQPNNGNNVVEHLNPNLGYTFELEQKNGCSGGELVRSVVIDPPAFGRIFTFSHWYWSN